MSVIAFCKKKLKSIYFELFELENLIFGKAERLNWSHYLHYLFRAVEQFVTVFGPIIDSIFPIFKIFLLTQKTGQIENNRGRSKKYENLIDCHFFNLNLPRAVHIHGGVGLLTSPLFPINIYAKCPSTPPPPCPS